MSIADTEAKAIMAWDSYHLSVYKHRTSKRTAFIAGFVAGYELAKILAVVENSTKGKHEQAGK